MSQDVRSCRLCGCTDEDCAACIQKTGAPCHWVEADLCSACAPAPRRERLDAVTMLLQPVVEMLAMIPTGGLVAHVNNHHLALERAHSLGPIVDPSGYKTALYGGNLEDARLQLEIVRHLLAARRVIDRREALVERHSREGMSP